MERQFKAEITINVTLPDDTPYPKLKEAFVKGNAADVAKILPLFVPRAPLGLTQMAIEVNCIAEVFDADRDNHLATPAPN